MTTGGRVAPRRLRQATWRRGLLTLVCLWWQGRRDGLRGLPAGDLALAQPGLCTPQMQVLLARAQEAFEAERLWLAVQLEVLDVERHRLLADREGLRERAARAERDVPAPLTPEELTQRRQGEERVDPAVVARRRRRAHDAEVAVRRAALDELRAGLQDVEARLAALPEHAKARRQEAHVRVQQIAQAARRRTALYQRSLLRRHPHGHALAGVWGPALPALPAWTDELTGRAA